MVKSDTSNRFNGLIQRCEDICGLGATGITGNATLYSQFIGWLNQWNRTGASMAIMAWDGADFDDKAYTTKPSGTFAGTTNRDYNFGESYKMLKIKLVNVTYDGTNWYPATPFDMSDYYKLATKDPNIDTNFDNSRPKYDERANGFDLYPLFTAAQVSAGASVYVEFFRAPQDFDTTSGTDTYEPALDLQFHHFPAIGASWEYCKLFKQDQAEILQGDLYGARTARGLLIRNGMIQDIEAWYTSKDRLPPRLRMKRKVKV